MWFLLACAPNSGTLQALVNVRADQIALDAELGTRLSLAGAGICAEFAPQSISWWVKREGAQVEVHPDIEEILALNESGVISVDEDTGAVLLSWQQVEFTPKIFGTVRLDVLRPQTSFIVSFEQNDGEQPGLSAQARYGVKDPDGDPVVTGELVLEVNGREQKVAFPSQGEQMMRWPQGGGYWPDAGAFSWAEGDNRSLQSLEALESRPVDQSWPVVVDAEDWSQRSDLALARDARGE